MPTFSASTYPFTAPIATSISTQRRKERSNCQRVQHFQDSPGSTGKSSTYPFKKRKAPQRYEDFARIALDLGFYGAQAPATKPKVIKIVKDIIGNSMTIISCGIGAQGAKPGSAIEASADFEIIGRAIYLSKKPREITKKYAEMIRKVVE